jgi:diamine N-acetyltransferase
MKPLTSDTIKLRALEPDDVDFLYKWENEPNVWRVSNIHAPISKFILASYIKSSDKDFWEAKQLRLIIESISEGPVGSIELFDFDPFHLRAGIGIIIFETTQRQKGIATQALKLIMEYALGELGIFQLYANISESNETSIALFTKLGFKQTGTKTNWLRIPGNGWENELLFQKEL